MNTGILGDQFRTDGVGELRTCFGRHSIRMSVYGTQKCSAELDKKVCTRARLWLIGWRKIDESWWPDWQRWVKNHTGSQIRARKPGNAKHKPLEDAPGSYVKVRFKL